MNHGPGFQALWAQLRREVRELQGKGYYGDGMQFPISPSRSEFESVLPFLSQDIGPLEPGLRTPPAWAVKGSTRGICPSIW